MFESTNPATGEVCARHAMHDDAEVERRVALAASAYRDWRAVAVDQRAALLLCIADAFEANGERLAETATREMGKTLASAKAEVEKCVAGFRYYAKAGPAFLKPVDLVDAPGQSRAIWLPMGPVLAIMPWNFPYWQVVRFLAPTLLAGNVGLLKHASLTQGCAALIEEMVTTAGAPEGVFQNLAIRSDKVDGLIADQRIVAATLTGSEGAGAKVAEAAGRNLKKVVLELGGSDPFIVMPSADIAEAAKVAVKARIQNAGQSCICAKRMIVHTDVYDDFAAAFAKEMAALEVGDPMDTVDMGPLSSEEQRDTVLEQLERAQAAGGKLTGGARIDRPGAWMEPGFLTDLPPDSDIAREELFGPVAMLFRVDDLDAAIALANDVPYGLGSSIWTNDAAERERLEREVEAGMTAVNQMLASSPQAPFGGIKLSGHGRELGPWGMHEFMNLKAVIAKD